MTRPARTPVQDVSPADRLATIAIHTDAPPTLGRRVLHLGIPADFTHADAAVDHIPQVVASWGWLCEGDADLLAHCLHEALSNALIHGHSDHADPVIDLEVWHQPTWWHVVVRDLGAGFCPQDLPTNFSPSHGRGMLIISGWFDRLAYWSGGRCAVMSRRFGRRHQY